MYRDKNAGSSRDCHLRMPDGGCSVKVQEARLF